MLFLFNNLWIIEHLLWTLRYLNFIFDITWWDCVKLYLVHQSIHGLSTDNGNVPWWPKFFFEAGRVHRYAPSPWSWGRLLREDTKRIGSSRCAQDADILSIPCKASWELTIYFTMWILYVCVCMSAHVCVRACVRACVRVCMREIWTYKLVITKSVTHPLSKIVISLSFKICHIIFLNFVFSVSMTRG